MSMEMDHSFTVPVPPEQAWDVLLDVERIAPCMPGVTVEEFDGEVVTGRIKIKVGPVSLTYRGTAKFTERDPDAHVVVVEASGKETRGAGTASATVRSSLEPESSGQATKVTIHTTMNVTGRPAQFGRGVMVEVGGKLVEKFADNLAQLISPGGATEADDAATAGEGSTDGASADPPALAETGPGSTQPSTIIPAASTASAPAAQPNEDSINLVRLVGPSILKRAIPVVIGAAAMALLGWRIRHRFPRGGRGQKA
jgi:carbon monoxide dehydrogenase subunit G